MSKPALQKFTREIMENYFRAKTRELLNKEITAMQINFDIIKAGFDFQVKKTLLDARSTDYYAKYKDMWTEKVLRENYEVFIKAVKSKCGNNIIVDLSNPPPTFMVKGKGVTGVWYYEENDNVLLIAHNFKALRSHLSYASKAVGQDQPLGFRKEKASNDPKSTAINDVSNVDIGHMASYGKEELNTVLSNKLGNSIKALENSEFKDEPTTQQLVAGLNSFIKALSNIHLEYTASFRKDTTVADKLTTLKGNTTIGHFNFIMTIPQFWELNQIIINDREFQAYVNAEKLFDTIIQQESSPPLYKMLYDLLIGAFQGDRKGAKYTTNISGMLDIPTGISVKTSKLTRVPPTVLSPQLRSIDGKFFSVLKLQSLINAQLHDRIRANMGTGYSTDVLNYRTGRFAKSAKVTAINKIGTKLDTYFNYMKYPYATFAPGGRQYKGDRRDPEKLISKSIREIAIQMVQKQFLIRPIVGE
jgi:hypothetical protein